MEYKYEILISDINARIEFLQEKIENINLIYLNLWELDVLRGQIKELMNFKEIIKGEGEE